MVKSKIKEYSTDLLTAVLAGLTVSLAYYFFQNSNGFAPGGVGGLATITYHLLGSKIRWSFLMITFNIPIFVLVSVFVDRKIGFFLTIYMAVQAFATELWELLGFKPYCVLNNGEDFEMTFACIGAGVISGIGFSLMLRHFGAGGGTYAIAALIKHFRPASKISFLSFFIDSGVVFVAFFVYGMKITPVMCTLINLFTANLVVDYVMNGLRDGYKFEIITDSPEKMARDIIETLGHGVTEINAMGMYSHTDKHILMCIIRKKKLGTMLKIIKAYPGSFANYSRVSEVLGRFKV